MGFFQKLFGGKKEETEEQKTEEMAPEAQAQEEVVETTPEAPAEETSAPAEPANMGEAVPEEGAEVTE